VSVWSRFGGAVADLFLQSVSHNIIPLFGRARKPVPAQVMSDIARCFRYVLILYVLMMRTLPID